jgi:hypothetical protein
MGLVMLGSASERALNEMMQYAHETAHEKIIRGLSLGIAFMFYGRQEQADKVIDQMLADKVRRIFIQLTLRTHAGARITFFDMEGCTPSLLRMLVPQTIRLFVNFCTWLSPIHRTMFEERPSHPLRSFYSRIRAKFPVWCSCSAKATTPMSDVVPHWRSVLPVQAQDYKLVSVKSQPDFVLIWDV